jgi:hypothetical protein
VGLKADPLTQPKPGYRICPGCKGKKVCSVCGGDGRIDGESCGQCAGTRWCVYCEGTGQLPETK